jgi:hypothetical protein
VPRFGNLIRALASAVLMGIAVGNSGYAVPIASADLVPAWQLNSEMTAVKAGRIVLIQVGFHVMYQMRHIPGSRYAGPASKPEGLVELKKLVGRLPRSQPIVIYCGCCPWNDCPNIRPAFQALREMGFKDVKALDIPNNLGADWTSKGFPVATGR